MDEMLQIEQEAQWEELGISNDFMFGKVMQDAELCKELLQRILPDLKIDHIEYPELQKSIFPELDAKGVRLDVYVQDDKNTVYDIEMQARDTKELPQRIRYYQSVVDLQILDKGQEYEEMNPSYIIFICPFDLFGRKRHCYTFVNICKEDKEIFLNDGATKIFLNADSEMDDVNQNLRVFLDYVAGKESDDSFIQKLKEAIKQAKKNREWRHEYMTLLARDKVNYKKGKVDGRIEGEDKMFELMQKLMEDKRFDEISMIGKDRSYRQKLYLEYNISD